MRSYYIFLICITSFFGSCSRSVHHLLQKVDLSDNANYEIKSMAGCCGCKALYYNVFKERALTEQFVVETNCGLYEPTKYIFSTDKKGNVTSFKSFIAVTDDSFTIPLTEIDKAAFTKLDSIYNGWTSETTRQIIFTGIKGFRESGKKIHFPVGVKMQDTLKYGM